MKKQALKFIFIIFAGFLFANPCVYSLSLDAQLIIEKLKADLAENKVNIDFSKQNIGKNSYVPGKKLASALKKLRAVLYGDNKKLHTAEKHIKKVALNIKRKKNNKVETYVPGRELALKLQQVIKILGKSDRNTAKYIFPGLIALRKGVIISSSGNEKEIDGFISKSKIDNFVSKVNDFHKLKHRYLANKPVKSVYISAYGKKTVNSKRTRRKNTKDLCSKNHKTIPNSYVKDKSGNNSKLPDKELRKFNTFIKNYEYKMPKNYRIIVR